MKKVQTLNYLSALPIEDGISVFLNSRSLNSNRDYFKVLSHEGLDFKDGKYVWVGNDDRILWGIDSIKITVRYGVLHPDDLGRKKFAYDLNLNKESFLSIIKEWYPDDYDFFLWHPEVLESKWNRA